MKTLKMRKIYTHNHDNSSPNSMISIGKKESVPKNAIKARPKETVRIS
jgi:hypothetical protein